MHAVAHARRLAVDVVEVVGHDRHLGRRAHDRERDQVGEGDLRAGLLELAAAAVERVDDDRADGRRRGDLAALVHVLGEHRRAALEHRGLRAAAARSGGCRAAAAASSTSALTIRPVDAGAGERAEVDVERGGGAARDRGGVRAVAVAGGCGGAAGGGGGGGRRRWPGPPVGAGAGAAAPAAMRPITCPTVTVSPSPASSSVIVPDAGAGSSTSTLSVEISTTVSPALTWSPTATVQPSTVPSVTDSPAAGVTMSTIAAPPAAPLGGVSAPRSGAAASAARPAATPGVRPARALRSRPAAISASSAPTVTTSPSGGEDPHERAARGRRDLGVDLVGRDLDDRLVGGDALALGPVPLEDRSLGHRIAHPGHHYRHRRPDSHSLRTLPRAQA